MTNATTLAPNDLYNVAVNQRRLLLTILGGFVAYIGLFVIGGVAPQESELTAGGAALGLAALGFLLAIVVLAVLWLIFLALLLSAMRVNIVLRIIALLAAFLPLISLLVLLAVSSHANGVLKRAGYKVGLLGVSGTSLAQLKVNAIRT